MAGLSIVAPSAVTWVTDFLYHSFYARPKTERTLEELRLAHAILGTRWRLAGRRIGIRDRRAFHSAFDAPRLGLFRSLDREALLEGGRRLFGDWFPNAWSDPARRAYGIVFETSAERRSFDPALRPRHAAVRRMTPPREPPARQRWATYPPVALPDPDAALELLRRPARWPDFSSAAGSFTPLGGGGLRGQTFEIVLTLHPTPHALVLTRGYVTCTDVRLRGAPLREAAARAAEHAEGLPDAAEPLAYIELTTHAGHFMGRGISRLIVYSAADGSFVCDIGSWDPLPPHLAVPYAVGGHSAQLAFWGPDDPEASMLAQLAVVTS
jgi:hypothetical protein